MKIYYITILSLAVLGAVWLFRTPSSWEIRNPQPASDIIVCFGDSLTYGTGAEKNMDYPSRLSGLTGRGVINAGIPGDTTVSALRRVDEILNINPGYVLITLGGNDLKNRMDMDQAFMNLEHIITRFQDNGALVVLGGIDVPLWGRGFGKEYRKLARKTGAVLVPNVFRNIKGKRALMSDPIHPNNMGYSVMADHFYRALKPYL